MALSTIANLAVGDVITEAWLDAVKDNLNDHKAFAEGSSPFVGTIQKFGNDASFYLTMNGGNPEIGFDGGGDLLAYIRSTNRLAFYVGGSERFAIDADGNIQGALFETAEQTITNTSTANIAHGFSTIPRLVFARYGTASGDSTRTRVAVPSYVSPGSYLRIEQVGATNIVLINNTGATVYAKAWALR